MTSKRKGIYKVWKGPYSGKWYVNKDNTTLASFKTEVECWRYINSLDQV